MFERLPAAVNAFKTESFLPAWWNTYAFAQDRGPTAKTASVLSTPGNENGGLDAAAHGKALWTPHSAKVVVEIRGWLTVDMPAFVNNYKEANGIATAVDSAEEDLPLALRKRCYLLC